MEECLKADDPYFLPQKSLCDTRREHDRISELPEEIIIRILSHLYVKEAAATSILSPRWSNLWKQTHILNFTSEIPNSNNSTSSWDGERCEYIKLVNSVLQSHKALILKQFKISFYVNKSAQSHVDKWLEFVFSRRVESLELEFQCYDCLEASDKKVVLEESLRETRRSPVFLKSLKSLCLNCLRVSGEDIKMFLRNCPSLENLKIKSATLTSDVDVCGENLMLKRLEIQYFIGRKSIRICAPNLEWIRVDDKSGTLFFENVPKLVEADFRIRSLDFVAPHFAHAVSCFTSQLQTLHLTLNHPKVFSWDGFPQMPKLKTLIVIYCGLHEHGGFLPASALIWAFPRLHKFKIKYFGDLEDEAAEMEVITNVGRPKHRHLKILEFELRGSISEGVVDHLVKFVKYVSSNCIALQRIGISPSFQGTSETRR